MVGHDANLSDPSSSSPTPNQNTVEIQSMSPTYSPSKYILQVNVTRSSWLVFDQSFDTNWVAKIEGQNGYLNHTVALGWANAYYLDRTGMIKITLFYQPQTTYEIVWIFSTIFVLLLGGLYVFMALVERGKLAGFPLWRSRKVTGLQSISTKTM